MGPRWIDGRHGEREALVSCYRTALALAKERNCGSVAFPLISSGIYGYPKDQAIRTAIDTIGAFLMENEMTVYLVIFDRKAYQISRKLFADITAYIDDNYADERTDRAAERRRLAQMSLTEDLPPLAAPTGMPLAESAPSKAGTQEDMLKQMDESFSEMLLRKIQEKGMTDVQCYKKANIDRKLFSKIRSDNYRVFYSERKV